MPDRTTPFEIISYQGAGNVRFGMSPAEVRAELGTPFESGWRGKRTGHPYDYFTEIQVFVYYTDVGKVKAIEFARPAQPIFAGLNLLEPGLDELAEFLSEYADDVIVKNDGLWSLALGIGAYAPHAKEFISEPSEAIIAFVRGYGSNKATPGA